jgi:hypothetical protein
MQHDWNSFSRCLANVGKAVETLSGLIPGLAKRREALHFRSFARLTANVSSSGIRTNVSLVVPKDPIKEKAYHVTVSLRTCLKDLELHLRVGGSETFPFISFFFVGPLLGDAEDVYCNSLNILATRETGSWKYSWDTDAQSVELIEFMDSYGLPSAEIGPEIRSIDENVFTQCVEMVNDLI